MASTTTIPQDIITNNILHRLPSKSVGQFRCVSKEWLFLLTDPQFIKTHQKTLNTNRFIFESNDGPLSEPHINTLTKSQIIFESTQDGSLYSVPYDHFEAVSPLTFEQDLHHFSIDGSVNGLVLASGYKDNDYVRLVLNPTTKDYIELPSSLDQRFFGMIGFGYDSVSGDYKVVVFSKFENFDRNVYVYNVRTNTMKLVMSNSPYQDYHFSMLPGVFVNGFIHWIFKNCSKDKLVIVAVSLADDKISELPPPSGVDMSDRDIKLVALGEKLAIFHQVKGDLWLMDEYGVQKSWGMMGVRGLHKPIVFYDSGKFVFLTANRLWIIDVEEGTMGEIVDISYMKIRHFIGSYAESLTSPKFRSNSNGR